MIACIPTKSRTKTTTYKLFQKAGIPFFHFIEPDQINEYDVPNKINIQKNDQGISYVRNFILDYARSKNFEWIIMCDDDVTEFGIAINGKCVPKDATIWHNILKKAEKLPFELYGLNYRQYAWAAKKDYKINNSYVEVCLLMNVKKITWQYRSEFNMKEDRDFVLQTIKYGNGCVRFLKSFYNTPGIATKEGGLYNEYQSKKDFIASERMASEWHPYIELVNKSGRLDIKTDFKNLANKYNKHFV